MLIVATLKFTHPLGGLPDSLTAHLQAVPRIGETLKIGTGGVDFEYVVTNVIHKVILRAPHDPFVITVELGHRL